MKKIFTLPLMALIGLIMAGCGTKNEPTALEEPYTGKEAGYPELIESLYNQDYQTIKNTMDSHGWVLVSDQTPADRQELKEGQFYLTFVPNKRAADLYYEAQYLPKDIMVEIGSCIFFGKDNRWPEGYAYASVYENTAKKRILISWCNWLVKKAAADEKHFSWEAYVGASDYIEVAQGYATDKFGCVFYDELETENEKYLRAVGDLSGSTFVEMYIGQTERGIWYMPEGESYYCDVESDVLRYEIYSPEN